MNNIGWELAKTVWAAAVGMNAFGTWAAWRHVRKSRREDEALTHISLRPISVMKPLCGAEPGLDGNLETFFQLEYPEFELLFSVASEKDPACEMVRKLMLQYPEVQAKLIVGAMDVGLNPKINNLVRSYRRAKYEVMLISDSNVRVAPDYLKRMVVNLGEDVGMVSSIISGSNPSGLGGLLEATYLNTFYAKTMTLASAIGFPCVIGKSMMFTRTVMERMGGILSLKDYVAEDYTSGRKVIGLGLRVVVMSEPVTQHIGDYAFEIFWNRHVRWGRIRKLQSPPAFFIELMLGSLVSGILGALVFRHLYGVPIQIFLPLHLLYWLSCDSIVMSVMGQKMTLRGLAVWTLRELSYLPLWIQIASSNSIMWRGNPRRVIF
jgi:ceramide glucosyltransferase